MTFLAIDVGNTRLKWALYDRPHPQANVLAQGAEFLENIETLADGPWASLPVPTHMLGCVVAGDAVKRRVQDQMELWDVAPQWVVSSTEEAGVTNGYDHPTRLGSDRWVAMVGARIDQHGKFLGGLILPGHGIMLRALESGTAGLHVPTGEVRPFPTNTSDALTSGGTYAIAGACERMVQHLRDHTGIEPHCVMTGGAGWKMAPSMAIQFELVDSLIFDGLLKVAQTRFA